jgi:glycosyltransferase involved in cell wall biosynthesis
MYNFLLINARKAACSIYKNGYMIYEALCDSPHYNLEYVELQDLDVTALNAGKIVFKDGRQLPDFDAYIFNYHHYTMRLMEGVLSENFHKLPGLKYAIILEMLPDEPVCFTLDISYRNGHFNGYMVIDPTMKYGDPKFFSFPRPLPKASVKEYQPRDIPVIGSFGLPQPNKGFDLLVNAVNQEFDQAVIRLNFPAGSYTAGYTIDREVEAHCRNIAKPGIDIQISNHYFTDEELVEWLAQNTVNAFFYRRKVPGLSAAIDQAVMSGRPIVVSDNISFRHVHMYQPPHPTMTFKWAMESGTLYTKRMQAEWNYNKFYDTFLEMVFDQED